MTVLVDHAGDKPRGGGGAMLIEADDGGGPRHFLKDSPIHAGDLLEVQVGRTDVGGPLAASWLLGRYEWHYRRGTSPSLIVNVPGGDGSLTALHVILPATALLRWPTVLARP